MKEDRRIVKVAEALVGSGREVLYTLGLGSCVALLLHDPVARVGGMAHVLLPGPHPEGKERKPAKYADTAVTALVESLSAAGAHPGRLEARLVGGASMFRNISPEGSLRMGERNLAAVREALGRAGIPVVGEEVGKEHGRSVYFHAADGRTVVTSVLHGRLEL